MIVVNTENIPGKEYDVIGLVTGSCIMCKNIGKDIGASFKNMVGGEMRSYTELMVQAKDQAVSYMVGQAQQYGADAIVNVRFSSTSIVQGGAEILVAGTAVKLK
ncbi:MAG: YbjQ family protein [Eubacteriales bacterium]|nr:YbjQ family protein [Eubacteriales bacterium]